MSKHLRVVPVRAEKRRTVDDFEHGCDIDGSTTKDVATERSYATVVEAFRDIVGDNSIKPEEIRAWDSNVYCDRKDGSTVVVHDGGKAGVFRCIYDRSENKHGRKPTSQEQADFQASKIKLWLADYDLYFKLQLVCLDEEKLAAVCGVNHD